MFRTFFGVSILLFSSLSMASDYGPELNDTVDYMTFYSNPQNEVKTQEIIDRVDEFNDKFFISIFLYLDDGSKRLIRRYNKDGEKIRQEYITDILNYCIARGGQIESVKVLAGEFEACKVVFDDGIVHGEDWYAANVPFGRIKSISFYKSQPSDVTTKELFSYSN